MFEIIVVREIYADRNMEELVGEERESDFETGVYEELEDEIEYLKNLDLPAAHERENGTLSYAYYEVYENGNLLFSFN